MISAIMNRKKITMNALLTRKKFRIPIIIECGCSSHRRGLAEAAEGGMSSASRLAHRWEPHLDMTVLLP
jgi:hypothetical protein